MGAAIAGYFYEFIFNPTRESSLCYRPKLFRFSAHDMAKVGSKSRLYQQQQQKLSNLAASTTIYRPQAYNQTIQHLHHSPTSRAMASNLINNSSLLKSSRNSQQLIPTSTSTVTHIQSSYLTPNNFDQMNYLQQQQQHQDHQQSQQQIKQYPHTANIDRSKSTAIINTLAAKQHQSTINIAQQRNNADLGKLAVSSYLNDSALYSNAGAASFSEL